MSLLSSFIGLFYRPATSPAPNETPDLNELPPKSDSNIAGISEEEILDQKPTPGQDPVAPVPVDQILLAAQVAPAATAAIAAIATVPDTPSTASVSVQMVVTPPPAPVIDPKDQSGKIELARTPDGLFRIREHVNPMMRTAASLIPFALGFAMWMWLTAGASPEARRIGPTILPSPIEAFHAIPTIWFDGALMRNIFLSLFRVLGGFTIACIIALPLGVLMGACTKISSTFSLVMTILSYLPMPALLPLTMAWWGSGEQQKIGFLALVTFSMLLPLVVRSIGNVDHKYVLSAYSQGDGSWGVLRNVLIPIAAPEIYGGLRMCLGVGWTYIVLAEVIKSDGDLGGVGNLIMVYHRLGHMAEVYLVVIAIGIVGMLVDKGCICLKSRLFPYMSSQSGKPCP